MDSISQKLKDGKLKPDPDLPEDLQIAIQTFIEQAAIVEEYEVDYIPIEYITNLIDMFAKYPEYSIFTYDIVKSLMRNNDYGNKRS